MYSKTVFRTRNIAFLVSLSIGLISCVKKSDSNNAPQSGPVATDIQNTAPVAALLEPQPMKLCVRPAHRLGVKKCVRTGKWVRFSVAANDVDNDRTDVFSSPRISLKKENFYPDTFRFLDGVNQVANYPDYYHSNAAYGHFAHMEFVMPNIPTLSVTYGYAGRDEIRENLTRALGNMNPNQREYVKIQHWNDGSTFKKFAPIYFEAFADYAETDFRYDCGWGEQDQGYDFTQGKTKEGIDVPKIPETFIWRKMAESCTKIPNRSIDGRLNYLPFNELAPNPISTQHKFTTANRSKLKVYNYKNVNADEQEPNFDSINPMANPGLKLDGSNTIFTNAKKEEISRWESIYLEDLKDVSFQPERTK